MKQNAKQKLSSERNWSLMALRAAQSQLDSIRKFFPHINIFPALQELKALEGKLDAEWGARRQALQENELDPR